MGICDTLQRSACKGPLNFGHLAIEIRLLHLLDFVWGAGSSLGEVIEGVC